MEHCMDSRQRLRAGLDVATLLGMEIGPLTSPIVSRGEGEVIYVDHADTETLRRKYAGHANLDVGAIVEVDAIWNAATLQQAIGPARKVDYVIASHVVEHVPDLLGWLNEVREVLRPGGQLRLIVPDRRFTFDRLRQETRLSDILFARLAGTRTPLAPMILDHYLEVVRVDAPAVWRGDIDDAALPRLHDLRDALATAEDATRNGTYHDVHCWVFTPASFASLMARAVEMALIDLECVEFQDTQPGQLDFYVALRGCADPIAAVASWRKMAGAVAGQAGQSDALARLAALEASTSWRITAPLRAFATVLSRMKRSAFFFAKKKQKLLSVKKRVP